MSVRCRGCGRKLVDPVSRSRRMGPGCARRAGLVASRRCQTVLTWSPRLAAKVGDGQLALFDLEPVP